jgi:hypothetical protein
MTADYQWSIDEYVMRCEDGDDIREIVVEGRLDRDTVADAMERWEALGVGVLDASYFRIGDEELAEHGLTPGVKAELIALADSLEQRHAEATIRATVAVVIDRDDELARTHTQYLLITDGYSMESYSLNAETLQRFVRVLLARAETSSPDGEGNPTANSVTGHDLLSRFLPAAAAIGGCRVALRALAPPLAPPDGWLRHVDCDAQGHLAVDTPKILIDVLSKAGQESRNEELSALAVAATAEASSDPFRRVRGHDGMALLHKLFKTAWGRRIAGPGAQAWTEDRLSRLLMLAVDSARLDDASLFRELKARFAVNGI